MRYNAIAVRVLPPGPVGGLYSTPPGPLAGFGEENGEGEMKRPRDGKGTEGEKGVGKGERREKGKWNLGGVCITDFRG